MAQRQALPRPVAVREVIQEIIRPGDWDVLRQRREIRRVWEATLPPALLAQSRLVDLRRKELWVAVSASPWAQELQFLKPRILQALEQALGPGVVRELRWTIGEGF